MKRVLILFSIVSTLSFAAMMTKDGKMPFGPCEGGQGVGSHRGDLDGLFQAYGVQLLALQKSDPDFSSESNACAFNCVDFESLQKLFVDGRIQMLDRFSSDSSSFGIRIDRDYWLTHILIREDYAVQIVQEILKSSGNENSSYEFARLLVDKLTGDLRVVTKPSR